MLLGILGRSPRVGNIIREIRVLSWGFLTSINTFKNGLKKKLQDSLDLHGSECEFVQSILEEEKKKTQKPLPLGRALRSLVCGCSCNFSAP